MTIDMNETKEEKYQKLLRQVKAVLSPSDHYLSRMANCVTLIQEEFSWLWVGFYLFDQDLNHLYLGPYQGPLACTQIPLNKGVCGAAYREKKTVIVPDVEKFPGHIACSSLSRSEIVVPIITGGVVTAVLDIDSINLNSFDELDKNYLEEIILSLSN